MSFAAKRSAYSDIPSLSSQSAIRCIAAPSPADDRAEPLGRLQESLADKFPA